MSLELLHRDFLEKDDLVSSSQFFGISPGAPQPRGDRSEPLIRRQLSANMVDVSSYDRTMAIGVSGVLTLGFT